MFNKKLAHKDHQYARIHLLSTSQIWRMYFGRRPWLATRWYKYYLNFPEEHKRYCENRHEKCSTVPDGPCSEEARELSYKFGWFFKVKDQK